MVCMAADLSPLVLLVVSQVLVVVAAFVLLLLLLVVPADAVAGRGVLGVAGLQSKQCAACVVSCSCP